MIDLKIFRASELVSTPWKNGGGLTREIFRIPATSDLNHFKIRCSIADVHQSGPFSLFPRHERVIMQLSGERMTLRSDAFKQASVLEVAKPFRFDGGIAIDCSVEGPSTDYNFMVQKGWAKVETHIVDHNHAKNVSITFPRQPVMLIAHLINGTAEIQSVAGKGYETLGESDTILVTDKSGDSQEFELRMSANSRALYHLVIPKDPIA